MLLKLYFAGRTQSSDDFGTGYSSLSLIQQLPITGLKIDKSFVRYLDVNEASAKLVKSVLILAENMGLTVIAEGVEKEVHEQFVKSNSKNQKGQGYYYSKPMPPADLEKLLNFNFKSKTERGA